MPREPLILGINSVYHESSACLLRGSRVVAFAEEERFNRRKHAKPASIEMTDQLPSFAIEHCLRASGVAAADIDFVAYSFDPQLRRPFQNDFAEEGSWGSARGEEAFLDAVRRAPAALSDILSENIESRWRWVAHETAHAASAYFASPFEDAAVLSLDGIGENGTGVLAHGRGRELHILQELTYPNSLGFVWEKLSKFVGLDEYSAPKLMALSAFARGSEFDAELGQLIRCNGSALAIDNDVFRFRQEDYSRLEQRFGPRRREGDRIDFRDAALARALQKRTEAVLIGLARHLKRATGSRNLCLAGGVALNCVAMGLLLNEGPFDEVFVQPLASDAGGSLGAALWVAHTEGGVRERFVMDDPYLGPAYSAADIDAALRGVDVEVAKSPRPSCDAASCAADGLIVGWFQGRAEVGPRALGARSIVADPRRPGMKELINLKVKHREYFRPFAPSVLEEYVDDWFAFERSSISRRFMSFAVEVRPDKRADIPAVLHVDGTSRAQVVSRQVNPAYHTLISEFHRLSSVPLVLNTSFNTFDEPIVCSPKDAIRTFMRTDLDVLFLEDRVVRRHGRAAALAA